MTLGAAMDAEGYLPTPGPMFHVVAKTRRRILDRFDRYLLSVTHERLREDSERIAARHRLRQLAISANFLELCLVAAGMAEAALIMGPVAPDDAQAQGHRVLEVCARLTGLDPRPVLQRHQGRLLRMEREIATGTEVSSEDAVARLTQVARGVTSSCPIAQLEQWGHQLDAAGMSHRCRKAYEGLVAFVRRHTSGLDDQMKTVGIAYSEGRLTLEDVGRILQVPPHDAVALLERYSFCRPLEVIALAPSRRSQRLQAIADEVRDSAQGQTASADLLDRDVIASQRIEGVDAHPWLKNRGD